MDIDTKKRLLSSFAAAEEFIQGKAGKMGDVMKKKTGIFYMTVCVFGISLAVCGIQADGRQNTSESQEEIQLHAQAACLMDRDTGRNTENCDQSSLR